MPGSKNRNGKITHKKCFEEYNEKIKLLIYSKTETVKNVETELKNEMIRCGKRRAVRKLLEKESKIEITDTCTCLTKKILNPKAYKATIPDFVINRYHHSQAGIFTEKKVNLLEQRSRSRNKSVHFKTDTEARESIHFLTNRFDNRSRSSGLTNSIRMARFKEELSESQKLSNKIKKHDFHEILNHLALCYTYQLIEVSYIAPDRDWSGSDLPFVDEVADFIFVGGYGNLDGVTECNNINLAVKKYQNMDFNNDEAVEALSHMYSLGHLLDGVQNPSRKDSKRTPLHVISDDEDSEKSNSDLISE